MINLVDYLRPDCSIVLPNGEILTAQEIKTYKNFYKKQIYEKLHGKTVGKVALIWSNNLDVILPAIKAMWELGVAISVHDFTLNVVTHPKFKNFYKHIDIIIGPPLADSVLSHIPHINALETKMNYPQYAEGSQPTEIVLLDPDQYPDQDYKLDQPIDGDTICCVTHTSGTTGEPKIVSITNESALDLVKENIKLFGFSDKDRVMHHKTLHHGSLFLNYAIPAFVSTDQHHWVVQKNKETASTFLERCAVYCESKKVTKWLIAYNHISLLADSQIKSCDLSATSLITVIGPNGNAMKNIFEKHKPLAVYNNFGCTELGTIAISKTVSDNVHEYSPNKFFELNSKIDMEILSNCFRAKFKNANEWKTIGDIVSMTDGTFVWHGRNTFLTFKDQKINVTEFDKWLKKYLNTDAYSLVPDFEQNVMYLAVFDQTLDFLNLTKINQDIAENQDFKNCFFSKLSFIEFKDVAMGMKPSQPILLSHFRGLLD